MKHAIFLEKKLIFFAILFLDVAILVLFSKKNTKDLHMSKKSSTFAPAFEKRSICTSYFVTLYISRAMLARWWS